MKRDALLRFLGVEQGAPAELVLGVEPGERDRNRILAARSRRLEQIRRHPAGGDPEAQQARDVVERAAKLLADRAGLTLAVKRAQRDAAASSGAATPGDADTVTPAAPTRPVTHPRSRARASQQVEMGESTPVMRPDRAVMGPLTSFDRDVIAILISSGGWNATSRARIIVQARRAGLSIDGLLTVIRGLANYSQSGGMRLAPSDLAQSVTRVAEPRSASIAPGALFMPPPEPSPWRTLVIAASAGLVTLVVGLVAVGFILRGQGDPASPVVVAPPRPGPPAPMPAPRVGVPARFDRPPMLQGNAVPTRAVEAADACVALPAALEKDVEIKLRVARDSSDPAEPVFRAFTAYIDTIADGWVLADASTRDAVLEAIGDALREAAVPSVAARLLENLRPAPPRPQEPIDVWRGAWRAGALAHLNDRGDLGQAALEQVGSMLGMATEREARALPDRFDEGARAYLDRVSPSLIDVVAFDAAAADTWEMWFAAQRACGLDESRERSLVRALRLLLVTDLDLARQGPPTDLASRLLLEADLVHSIAARDGLLALFGDSRVDDHDLWVVTSLLAHYDAAPWFPRDCIMPDAGGARFRNRVLDRIATAWPSIATTEFEGDVPVLAVDPAAAGRWLSAAARASAAPWRTDEQGLLGQLVIAGRLNLVAALLASGRGGEAERALLAIERALDDMTGYVARLGASGGGQRPGQPVGSDGNWAAEYEEARRSVQDRMQLLRGLRTTAGSDLGPIDAETLARIAFRGSNEQVRSLARAVLIEMFSAGPIVAMAMLDHFTEAPRSGSVSEMIAHLTGAVLPVVGNPEWPAAARLALAQHAMSLRPRSDGRVDALGAEIVATLTWRAALVGNRSGVDAPMNSGADSAAASDAPRPHIAATRLAAAWRGRAAGMLVRDPEPSLDDLARRESTRRRLAQNGIQRLTAELLTTLEHSAYVAAAERAAARELVGRLLANETDARRDLPHVLMQAVEVERTIGALWSIRMGLFREDER